MEDSKLKSSSCLHHVNVSGVLGFVGVLIATSKNHNMIRSICQRFRTTLQIVRRMR